MTTIPPNPNSPAADRGAGDRARLDELLADRAVQGLSAAEESELRELLARCGPVDEHATDRAAAALLVALSTQTRAATGHEMPAGLRDRLRTMGQEWASGVRPATEAHAAERNETAARPQAQIHVEPRLVFPARPQAPVVRFKDRVISWGGWAVAAASVAIAAMYATRDPNVAPRQPGETIARGLDEIISPNEALTKMEERAAAGAPIVALSGSRNDGVEADLHLDPESREAFLTVAGLDVTADTDTQYQVWLLDAGRDHPVDGGTFDVRDVQRGAKIIVPVNPHLPLRAPVGFALSKERRGGVVVTDEKRVLMKVAMPIEGPMPSESHSAP